MCLNMYLPVLGLQQWQVLSGVSADFLKVKFPVIICPVLTIFSHLHVTVCSEFGFVSKIVLFCEILSTVIPYD